MTKHLDITNIKLPRSLRRYISQKKAAIRREFGKNSPQEQEFFTWINERKKEKIKRIENKD